MRPVALVLALMIMAIACVDPLCCSDGCTRTDIAATNHTTPTGGDCPICQPGSLPARPTLPDAGLLVASTAARFEPSIIDSIPRSIEHPPRTQVR
jgi:hypothetical protein